MDVSPAKAMEQAMKEHYLMFAAYNVWANDILYNAVAKLSDEQYRKDCGAFFGSVHGTLNHLLVGDIIWMHRFDGKGEPLKVLDMILHEDFDALLAARKIMDERIIDYAHSLDEATLAASFSYRTIVNPEEITQPLSPALAQFFNHQTHHRGQVHSLLTRLAGEAPSLDLLYYLRENMGS